NIGNYLSVNCLSACRCAAYEGLVAFLTATTMATFAPAGNAAPSPLHQHVLHVFPSFGVGGVPLRMVRIINHFGKRFRHTVIALDNNFEAAGGLAGDLDLVLSPVRAFKQGTLYN